MENFKKLQSSEFITEWGENVIEKANENNILQFYDYMSGNFTLTQEDFLKYEKNIKNFMNDFESYIIILENIEIYRFGCPYLEKSKSEFVYFLIDRNNL